MNGLAGTITGCIFSGTAVGREDVGGIAGWNKGQIGESQSHSEVTVSDRCGGGICGLNGGWVSFCYSASQITGPRSRGITGRNAHAVIEDVSVSRPSAGTRMWAVWSVRIMEEVLRMR